MKAEIISIGTEILLGQITDTNSTYLSRKLAEIGIDVFYHSTVGDNFLRLYAALTKALARSDITITIGGLGPTVDDITFGVVSKVLDKRLVLNKAILNDIKSHFKGRHIKFPKDNIKQSFIPEGSKFLLNKVGTAPGLINKKYNYNILINLPGPPRELIPMFEKGILPYLTKISSKRYVILTRAIRTTGLAESQVHPKIKGLLKLSGATTVGIYARPGEIDLKITTKAKNKAAAKRAISKLEKKILKRLNDIVYGFDEQTLEENVALLLIKNKRKLAVAESCTGGLLSNRLTNISGSSKFLNLSVVAYSNEAKIQILGIPEQDIKRYGAVSKEVAKLMSKNVMLLANADLGISITGIAGPTGATKKKPVGLVFISLSYKDKNISRRFYFKGSRKDIKFQSTQAALDMLRKHVG